MGIKEKLQAPGHIADHHVLEEFCCGIPSLDNWLKAKARKNESARASRTYVLCHGEKVIGYYALASGSIAANQAPGKVKRNMPDPIPVMILGRLTIDQTYQGKGLGNALLRDAILRILQAADIVGIRAILVHALSEQAKHFYEKRSFIPSPIDPMTLVLPLQTIHPKETDEGS